MRIEQIMTRQVVTVAPDTTLKQVASLLVERRISGVPVCDATGKVLGVVTEADILWKELGVKTGAGLLDRILDSAYGSNARIMATTAGEAMTAPAVTVSPDDQVAEAAQLMIDNGVNRLPVVRDGRLVGIVARADLVRAFRRTDDEIAAEIADDVLLRSLWVDPESLEVDVVQGHVTIRGVVENRTTAGLVEQFVRRVPGVASLRSELTWRLDDRNRRISRSAARLTRRV